MSTLSPNRLLPILLLTTLLGACAGAPTRASMGPRDGRDEAAIRRVVERRSLLSQRGDSVAMARLFTEDAVVMATNLVGTREIKRWEQAFAEQNELNAEYVVDEVQVNGDWAYARIRISGTLTKRPGGSPERISGQELALFQRQADGSWRIARLMANSNVTATLEMAASSE